MFTVVVLCSQYSSQYYELHIFLQTEQSKKQQKCLQNVFDNQSDGVIILSKRAAPPKIKPEPQPQIE